MCTHLLRMGLWSAHLPFFLTFLPSFISTLCAPSAPGPGGPEVGAMLSLLSGHSLVGEVGGISMSL